MRVAAVDDLLTLLPPLPLPDPTRREQAVGGARFVCALAAVYLAVVLTLAVVTPSSRGWLCFAVVAAMEAAALYCLHVIMTADAGIICREQENCFPLPPEVQARLAAGESLGGLSNIADGDCSFCVRCCVRRRPGRGKSHHCSVCQRCVFEFDHHCYAFGRCIAGSLWRWRGNMPHFRIINGMNAAGMMVTLIAIAVSIGLERGWPVVLAWP